MYGADLFRFGTHTQANNISAREAASERQLRNATQRSRNLRAQKQSWKRLQVERVS